MWAALAKIILRNRFILLAAIILLTVFMGYKASKVSIAYSWTQVLPSDDSANIEYENFKKQFGQDGTVMVVGMQTDGLFSNVSEFNDWSDLTHAVKNSSGIQDVVSAASIYKLVKNDSLNKFQFLPLLQRKPVNQHELDSVKKVVYSLPFYDGFILNKKTGATLMAITFNEKAVNSPRRVAIVDSLRNKIDAFSKKYNVDMHYSGMPYIRTVISRKIMNEMKLFLVLAALITGIILSLFFRSLFPVIFPLIIVMMGVVWALASLTLFGFQVTVLTVIIPPLIIVIGVPNSILLLNKYHTEYSKHQNKMRALSTTIRKIGVSLFLANVTTAIGFAVFCFTHSQVLFEFGLIASLNVMSTYIISLILIPIIFSLLPSPKVKHMRHLERKNTVSILSWVDRHTQQNRKTIYVIAAILVIISAYGITRIEAIGYVVDDLPKSDPVYADMRYFESRFGGVLPFEVKIDTRKPNGVFANEGKTLYKLERLEKLLRQYPIFSHPLSVLEGIKYANQAYHDGESKYFILPTLNDLQSISQFAQEAKQKQSLFKSFIDSTKQFTRVDIQMADIGSIKMKQVLAELVPRADSIFNYSAATKSWAPDSSRYKVSFTGSCLIFLRGNDFLVSNLIESVILAVVLIALIMFLLFMSPRMVIIATLPSLIPLMITLGLMGFFNIHLKPSTILIFSIAFGISSDGTMYFLTKYKQELKRLPKMTISEVVSLAIRETGVSMIYTAIILSFGFMIFAFSGFGGTKALGILISVTLLLAYCSNLILLPSFMLAMEQRQLKKSLSEEGLIELDDNDDEEDDIP
jgi:uncharacterized protein